MAALRRTWFAVLLGLVAVAGLACSGRSSTSESGSRTTDKATTVRGDSGATTQQSTGGAKGAAKPAGVAGGPADDGVACKQCQSSKDTVKLSDADGFEFETGSAEAGRIDANRPSTGDEKPATFDAGRGLKGTTGSSNLHPR